MAPPSRPRRTARLALLAAAILAAAPAGAQAPPPPTPYEEHLASGKRLVEEESWSAALVELEAAYAAEPRAAPLLQIAVCEQALQRWPRAIAAIERALRDHAATMDEAERKAAEQDLAELRAQTGSVEVTVTPEEATLRVDGEDQPVIRGKRVIALGPGPHRLEARLAGWTPAARTVTVGGGETAAITLGLSPEGTPSPEEPETPGPPVRGPYGLAAFTTFVPLPPTDFSGTALGFAGGLRLGYRFASIAGGELLLEYAHAGADGQGKPSFADLAGSSLPFAYGLSSFRAALGVRLMTTGPRVRFVQVFGGGLSYDAIHWTPGAGAGGVTRQGAAGVDGLGISETGIEVDLSRVLLGLSLQQVLGSSGALQLARHDQFSADTFGGPQYSLGLGIRGGYRLW
jgi:hypothetical protein